MTLPSFASASRADMARETGYAKINLALHVTGKRADGYHLLDSLVVFADMGDSVTLRPALATSLQVTGEFASAVPVEGNHALLACETISRATGLKEKTAITLEKHLPVGAGLGGGSSDAAAVARGMNRLYHLGLTDAQMAEILLPLGADMPACLYARPLRMRGIGEDITPLSFPSLPVLLVHPRQSLATPLVFRALQRQDFVAGLPMEMEPDGDLLPALLHGMENTLEKAALRVMPEIAEILQVLRRLPKVALARMSGSGSACFALFPDDAALMAAQGILRQSHPHWWIAGGRILSA